MTLALGIEIGGTKLQAGVGGPDGRLTGVARRRVDPARGGAGIREVLPSVVEEALAAAKCRLEELRGIGVGFGGPVDSGRGRVLVSHQIEGWADFPLRDWTAERWRLPVTLQNDAKTAALAEATFGAGRGCRRIFYMNIGSGIGGGLVVDGKVDTGQGLGAGEIGHTWVTDPATGKPEKLELVASGWSIGKRAKERLGGDPTAEAVYAAAERGDAAARALIEESCEALGTAIANVVALLHPERVVVGGGVSLMGPLFWALLRAKAEAYAFKPFAAGTEIVRAGLGEEVVLIGAVRLGLGASAPTA